MTPLSSDAKIPCGEVGYYKGCRRAASKAHNELCRRSLADSFRRRRIGGGGARILLTVALVKALHELGRVAAGLKLRVVHDLQMERHGRLDPFDHHRFECTAHA